MNERDTDSQALLALGDQVQEACKNSGVEIAGFVIFARSGPVEIRTAGAPLSDMLEHLRLVTVELNEELNGPDS